MNNTDIIYINAIYHDNSAFLFSYKAGGPIFLFHFCFRISVSYLTFDFDIE